MGVIQEIPRQARPIYTGNIFTGTFNVPTIGVYDFSIPVNENQEVLELYKGTVYLIDKISIGGTIAEEIYNNSINTQMLIKFRRKVDLAPVYKLPFPVVKYLDNSDLDAFVSSEKQDDFLTMTVTGILNQIPATVGIVSINLNIHLSIYAMDSTDYENWFKRSDYWRKNNPTEVIV